MSLVDIKLVNLAHHRVEEWLHCKEKQPSHFLSVKREGKFIVLYAAETPDRKHVFWTAEEIESYPALSALAIETLIKYPEAAYARFEIVATGNAYRGPDYSCLQSAQPDGARRFLFVTRDCDIFLRAQDRIPGSSIAIQLAVPSISTASHKAADAPPVLSPLALKRRNHTAALLEIMSKPSAPRYK